MMAEPAAGVSTFLLLSDDPLLNDMTFRELLRSRSRSSDCLRWDRRSDTFDLLWQRRPGSDESFLCRTSCEGAFDNLSHFDEFVSVVNGHVTPSIDRKENNRLLDALFRPALSRGSLMRTTWTYLVTRHSVWRPFHGECIADSSTWVAIALKRPCVNNFAAFLRNRRQGNERAGWR